MPPIRFTNAAEVYAPMFVLRFLVKIALVPHMMIVKNPIRVYFLVPANMRIPPINYTLPDVHRPPRSDMSFEFPLGYNFPASDTGAP